MIPAGQDVRVNWPEHETHGTVGYVSHTQSATGMNLVHLSDGTQRFYPDANLVKVRRVVSYVDEP